MLEFLAYTRLSEEKMYVVDSRYGGVRASVYWMNPGDKLPRHSHDGDHSCHVLSGAVEVQIYDHEQPENIRLLYWKGGHSHMMLPKDIDHEIRAILPNTVLIQMMQNDTQLFVYKEPAK